jgi:hypothetical protein
MKFYIAGGRPPTKQPATRLSFRSEQWPDVHGVVWNDGAAWFSQCWSENARDMAKTDNHPTREAAVAHVKLVLGLVDVVAAKDEAGR